MDFLKAYGLSVGKSFKKFVKDTKEYGKAHYATSIGLLTFAAVGAIYAMADRIAQENDMKLGFISKD